MNFKYTRHVGKIKFYQEHKGYGFITCNESGKDYFFNNLIAEKYGITERYKNYEVKFEVAHDIEKRKTFVHSVSDVED